jgi:hypothetical protein
LWLRLPFWSFLLFLSCFAIAFYITSYSTKFEFLPLFCHLCMFHSRLLPVLNNQSVMAKFFRNKIYSSA